jgi:hypothetical protein
MISKKRFIMGGGLSAAEPGAKIVACVDSNHSSGSRSVCSTFASG